MEKIFELIDNRILELMREQRQTQSNKVYDRCVERIGELITFKARLLEVEKNGTTTNSR